MISTGSLIALAAGGTGGHMFPAEALANVLKARGYRIMVLTDSRGEIFADGAPDVSAFRIRSSTVRPGLWGKVKTVADLFRGYREARRLLMEHRPVAMVGFGGYPSAPPVAAAGRLGIPVILHEQNAILGRANRMLARWARHLATGLDLVGDLPPHLAGHTTVTGNPVRAAIAELATSDYTPPKTGSTGNDATINLLVFGGSQGAHVFSEIVPEAVSLLPAGIQLRLRISQQCRSEDLEATRERYRTVGIDAELSPFFDDVPRRLAEAHLVICRSGASTVAEITAVGRPAILVPYPFAMDDHQTANATALDRYGAAWLMPQPAFTAAALRDQLASLLGGGGGELASAAAASRSMGRRDAGSHLADLVTTVIDSHAGSRQEAAA